MMTDYEMGVAVGHAQRDLDEAERLLGQTQQIVDGIRELLA